MDQAISLHALYALDGKLAVVTGGGSGIGAMIATGLTQLGVKVILVGRSIDKLERTREAMPPSAVCELIAADLSSAAGRQSVAEIVATQGNQLDILVNNAGSMAPAPIETLSEADWDDQLDINLKAVFFLCQALLPALRKAPSASIVNMGSIAGIVTRPREIYPYISAKAGVHHLTHGLARRLGSEGIRVNAIAPGYFPTDMMTLRSGPAFDAVMASIPLGRLGSSADIVGLVAFLASPGSAYINGAVIPLDGGVLAC